MIEYSLVICSTKKIMHSIQKKLFLLPYATTVLSGHGPITTLAEEMANNPYVKVWFACLKREFDRNSQ